MCLSYCPLARNLAVTPHWPVGRLLCEQAPQEPHDGLYRALWAAVRSWQASPNLFLYQKLSGLFITLSGLILPWLQLMGTVPSLINFFFPENLLRNPSDW